MNHKIRKKTKHRVLSSSSSNQEQEEEECKCGLTKEQHKIFFTGMITDKAISINHSTKHVANHLNVCSNPIIQLKCHNREPGYPAVENTLSYGAPSWRWQILAGPFVDGRAYDFIKLCGRQKRTPLRRLLQFIKLSINYNQHKLIQGETPLTLYFVGDITMDDITRLIIGHDPNNNNKQ